MAKKPSPIRLDHAAMKPFVISKLVWERARDGMLSKDDLQALAASNWMLARLFLATVTELNRRVPKEARPNEECWMAIDSEWIADTGLPRTYSLRLREALQAAFEGLPTPEDAGGSPPPVL